MSEVNNEQVIHPSHYNKGDRKECWDEMKELFGDEAVAIFDVLSAYKYHYRKGEKEGNPEEQDLAKIKNYMSHSADIIVTSESKYMGLARHCYRTMKKVLTDESSSEDTSNEPSVEVPDTSLDTEIPVENNSDEVNNQNV